MKKIFIDGISKKLIKKIALRDLRRRVKKMGDAINGNTDVFTGIQPHDEAAIAAMLLTFSDSQGAYAVGGLLKRNDFFKAKKALYNCLFSFIPYVNKLANGDKVILDLSTLPLLSEEDDYAQLIADGAIAKKITARQGENAREIITNCASFGLEVGYMVIISEGMPLPEGFSVGNDGTIKMPSGTACIVNCLGGRTKVFYDLLPKTEYFVYYVLTYSALAGVISKGVSVVTSA